MIESIYKSSTPVSSYQPSKEICDFTKIVKDDFSVGMDILNKPYAELNDLSPIERDNRDKRTFNAFVDETVEDPNEAWKWRGTRSKARNKAIAMHAQLTAGYIIPMFMAQNDSDEEDRGFSDAMRDCCEYLVNNSNYKSSFLMASMGMLVNTVTYMGAEYAEIYQTIKQKTEQGYEKVEILDEVLSGFQAPIYSTDQVLIANAFEQNIQRHRFNIVRKYIDYNEAKAKYGDHPNWEYVKPGFKSVYSESDGVFYDIKDDAHPMLVEEATYKNRGEDIEVCFIGGIYMGDDDVEANPIRHRDNRGAPKYNITPFGYQRISEHFYFYKSLMNAQYWDNNLLDAQYEVGMNRIFLETNMPLAVTGQSNIDSAIVFPNSIAAFENENVKVSPMLPSADIGKIFSGMSVVEKSMEEASVSDTTAGQLPGGDQKATGIAIAERNAQTLLRGVGKNLAESMVQYGGLMADIIVNHFSAPQVEQLVGDETKIKYRTFILKDKMINGKNVSKVIRFDDSLLGIKMTEDEKNKAEMKMLEKSGYPDHQEVIYRLNPELFSRMRYLVRIEPEKMFAKNEEFTQAMYSQIYNQFQANPYVSLESLTRKTLYQYFRGETDEIMQKQQLGASPMNNVLGGDKASVAGDMAVKQGLSSGLSTGIPKAPVV